MLGERGERAGVPDRPAEADPRVSGGETLATSNGAFVTGEAWRGWRNDLFVSTLKQNDVRRFELSEHRVAARVERRAGKPVHTR